MSKLLSETHPTLHSLLGSDALVIYTQGGNVLVSIEALQSCTVDRKEHEQTIDTINNTINKNWIGYGKLCERKTLCRVREVLDKYMVPRGVYKELSIEDCGHSQCSECEYHCEPKSSNALISDSCSHINKRDCGDRSYCVDCREYIYDGHGESCEGSMCGCKGRRK